VTNPTSQLHEVYAQLEELNISPRTGSGALALAKQILDLHPNLNEYVTFAFAHKMPLTHNVVLIHGIQDDGEWVEPIKAALKTREDINVIAGGYGFLKLRGFAFSQKARDESYRKVADTLLAVPQQNQVTSIICHSFGTYCVTRALIDYPSLAPYRLVLCGGVVARDFGWSKIPLCPSTGRIVNDCGNLDNVPIWAHRWNSQQFGNTGRLGFAHDPVIDRYHEIGHSGFLTPEFAAKYWASFIAKGTIENGCAFRKLSLGMRFVAGRI
jgi:hypothetical protein